MDRVQSIHGPAARVGGPNVHTSPNYVAELLGQELHHGSDTASFSHHGGQQAPSGIRGKLITAAVAAAGLYLAIRKGLAGKITGFFKTKVPELISRMRQSSGKVASQFKGKADNGGQLNLF